jgi:hypothetical protein
MPKTQAPPPAKAKPAPAPAKTTPAPAPASTATAVLDPPEPEIDYVTSAQLASKIGIKSTILRRWLRTLPQYQDGGYTRYKWETDDPFLETAEEHYKQYAAAEGEKAAKRQEAAKAKEAAKAGKPAPAPVTEEEDEGEEFEEGEEEEELE